jgi:hypothetical protein
LVASLKADELERDRLKAAADASLARFHQAVREFTAGTGGERAATAAPDVRAASR